MCSEPGHVPATSPDIEKESFTELDHADAAEAYAAIDHENSGGEGSRYVQVQEIDADGSPIGDPQVFAIEIDWSPSFTAIPKAD